MALVLAPGADRLRLSPPDSRRLDLASRLRAAAHPADHFVAGNAVPVAEFLKLLEVELIGHFPQRIVSRLRVTHVTQSVNQPLPAIRHLHPQALCST
jgi:hypothetical protein